MSHGLPDVTLQSTLHEVILHGLREVTSERQINLHDPSLTSMVLMVQNGRKCITHLLYSKTIVDFCFSTHGVLLYSILNHFDQRRAVNMTSTVQ